VLGAAGSELVVDAQRGEIHEIHRDHRRADEREVHLLRDGEQRMRGDVIPREHEARDALLHHLLENFDLLPLREGLEVGHLGGAETCTRLFAKYLKSP